MDTLLILDLWVIDLNLLALFQIHLQNPGLLHRRLNYKNMISLYIMLNDIRKFNSKAFHNIRLIFHHTHCESDCGIVGCACDNDGVSTSSEST